MKKRLTYLDMARGIAIILVVLGHCYSDNLVKTWIYSFHLPLFFIITGCLDRYKDTDIKIADIIIKRLKSLMVPYISFSVLYIIIRYFVSHFNSPVVEQTNLMSDIKNTVILNGVGVMWFLPTLFFAEMIYYILKKYINNNILRNMIIVIMCILPIAFNKESNVFIVIIMRSFIALGFITIGYYLFKMIDKIKYKITSIIVLFACNILFAMINGSVDLHYIIFGNYLFYIVSSVSGSLAVIMLTERLGEFNILSFYGENSLVVMGTQSILILLAKVITNKSFQGIISGTLLFLLIIIIEIPIIIIINKYFRIMIGKRISN